MDALTRVTVNFTAKAVGATHQACELTGLSRTDCLNRAIQLYAVIEQVRLNGGQLLIRDTDGKVSTLEIL